LDTDTAGNIEILDGEGRKGRTTIEEDGVDIGIKGKGFSILCETP